MNSGRWLLAATLIAMSPAGVTILRAQGYGGPSLLSRGGNQPGIRGRAPVNFNMYASVRGIYDTGLIAPQLNESGELEGQSVYGLQVEGGVYGGKDWRRHSLGIDYRGDYRHQPAIRGFSGANHALSFHTQHRLSRRFLLMLQQTGGTTNRAFGGFAAPTFGDLDRLGVPLSELFDVRIYYAQSAAVLSYQRSGRTTLFAGADGFFIKRKNLALINGQGVRAQGGWSYRVSRRTTLVANLQYLRFEYPRVYAKSDMYGAGMGFQRILTRNLQLEVFGGAYYINSSGVQEVELSPEVAAILGRPTGTVAFVRSDTPPLVEATLSYTQERGKAYVSAANGVNAGNGVFLTTSRTTVNGGYSYSGIRKLSLGVSAGWARSASVALDLPSFEMWQAGGGFSYRFAEHFSLMGQLDRRFFGSDEIQGRSGTSVTIGLAYTPSRFPISIW